MITSSFVLKSFRSGIRHNLHGRRLAPLVQVQFAQPWVDEIRTNHGTDHNMSQLRYGSSTTTATSNSASNAQRFNSTMAATEMILQDNPLHEEPAPITNPTSTSSPSSQVSEREMNRLRHMRNVGVFAHVDAGKTTVTERMLALAGIVGRAGSVDDGNTVTDYLPAERERGITIQSAAIRFPWAFHNSQAGDFANDRVNIALIDTPGHVDFSVEVNRSVAVLDGAVLVVDSAAGVQAQTQTVWRAMTRPSLNNHQVVEEENPEVSEDRLPKTRQDHFHEPLPCLAVINKMDKIGADFHSAVQSLRQKLPGANPLPIQLPVFRAASAEEWESTDDTESILEKVVVAYDKNEVLSDDFMGIVDLIHMRVVIWPHSKCGDGDISVVENCIPTVIPLWTDDHELLYPDSPVTEVAVAARSELFASMAEVDETMEELFLNEQDPTTADLRQAIRRATISHRILPVMAAAAVQGKGIEPCLDAIADFLPSPIDRMPPTLTHVGQQTRLPSVPGGSTVALGHCYHPTLLALAFKVLHMKCKGGSGDGRVVFARIYSGKIRCKDTVQVITPPTPGEKSQAPGISRTERVGGMLELTHFCNLENGEAQSGDVCALVGLKNVVTGDTIMMSPAKRRKAKNGRDEVAYCTGGFIAPKPVLTVQLEAESTSEQTRLTEALSLLCIEDPSLVVEEEDSRTLLSGLGELHIEVTLDRIRREHDLNVLVGKPSVAYRETVSEVVETDGLLNFDRTFGDTRLQASIHLKLEPGFQNMNEESCQVVSDPEVTISPRILEYLDLSDYKGTLEELEAKSVVVRSLMEGCRGALKRGPSGYAMANMRCHVEDIDSEGGIAGITAMPGSLRAACAFAIETLLSDKSSCVLLEPKMSMEVSSPNEKVGNVLSDLTNRRGSVGDVQLGDVASSERNALLRGEVPLIEILGYANSLRSLTGGEASFTAEYKGHAPCSA